MSVKIENRSEPEATAVVRFLQGYVRLTAALLAVVGLFLLLSACRGVAPLRQPDGLLGLSTWELLVLAGVLHLMVGGYLFVGRDLMNQGLLALWVASDHLVYALGLAWLHVPMPLPAQKLLAWETGLSPSAQAACWKVLIVYLLLGNGLIVVHEWRRYKQMAKTAFLVRWRKLRERTEGSPATSNGQGGLPPPAQSGHNAPGPLGRAGAQSGSSGPVRQSRAEPERLAPSAGAERMQPNSSPADGFKFSCPGCGQHIRCDASYCGRRIKCPACQKEILVPAQSANVCLA